jgi:hypothetical protein
MAESWNLPRALVDVMRYHHRPDELEPADAMVDCVHIGDYLSSSMGFGLGGDGLGYRFDENALTRVGLHVDDLDSLADAFMVSYDKHERLFEETK